MREEKATVSETSETDPRQSDGLAGDDADYDDLDELEAIGMGILKELTLIRQTLQAQQRADMAAQHSTASRDQYRCTSCGDTFRSREKARQHAVETHDAPRSTGHWQRLIEDESDGGED